MRFERWLSRTEDEIDENITTKPTTRLEACQLLATFKVNPTVFFIRNKLTDFLEIGHIY